MKCFLHVCGGDPNLPIVSIVSIWFSPRMWRWSRPSKRSVVLLSVFSTYVEVIPFFVLGIDYLSSFLHVCGGDPFEAQQGTKEAEFSPRMWRWSSFVSSIKNNLAVFSTYVEVILTRLIKILIMTRFLHVCGGDPKIFIKHYFSSLFSPRMWRWSSVLKTLLSKYAVFSTYVEVILSIKAFTY